MRSTQCMMCKHYGANGVDGCTAFPDKIPSEILGGMHDHSQAFPGDNGIRYERAEHFSEEEEPPVDSEKTTNEPQATNR